MKAIYLILGLIIIIGAVFLLTGRGDNESANLAETQKGEAVITFTDSGYSPNEVTIKKGERVTFINDSSVAMWPATAIHPTHRVYPNSDIGKCGTPEASAMFDACRAISSGESYSFIFNEVGTWKYHDHLNLGNFGTIVVE